MAKKRNKKTKPAIGSDPFSGHEDIIEGFFSPSSQPEMGEETSQPAESEPEVKPISTQPEPMKKPATEKKAEQKEADAAPAVIYPQEIIDDFIQESQEGLDQLDTDLVALEDNPGEMDLLNKVFRTMHTLKGAAGFLGFNSIQSTAHKSEDVLNRIRTGDMESSPEIVDVLLEALDVIKHLMSDLANSGKESTDIFHVMNRLEKLLNGAEGKSSKQEILLIEKEDQASSVEPEKTGKKELPVASPAGKSASLIRQNISTIRVDVERLDSLMNLAGELVLARNRQVQLIKEVEPGFSGEEEKYTELNTAAHQLDFITTELQFAVMKTRMLPVSTVFSKFTRVVRDLSRSLGKEVELVIEGETTELDKNVIEEIGDPMVHLIRNAVDHGIEKPEDRKQKGKNPKGTVKLSAYYEGSYVIIEIKDDGKGMDPEKLKEKAVEKGMFTAEEVYSMSRNEAFNLVFAAGFSTAEEVSDVSGRGVGMDVVCSNIEKLKGIIELDSSPGHGSLVKIKIPLTLAILQTLLCKVGGERYAIPLDAVKETVRVPASELRAVRGKKVIKLRDEILPLVFLHEVLDLEAEDSDEICVVVVQHGMQRLGCVVQETIGQEEVVIKSLDVLKDMCAGKFFSGAAILGDGIITLILDVSELMRFGHTAGLQGEGELEKEEEQRKEDVLSVLLVDDGAPEQYALPIKSINNIENIASNDIESVGGRKVVRYEGEVLPIIHLYDITSFPPARQEPDIYLVISKVNGDTAGLAVNKLRGMKEINRSEMDDCFSASGVAYSAVLDNRVTLILKEDAVIKRTLDESPVHQGTPALPTKHGRILVVDDSPVARETIKKQLLEDGFDVILAVDGKDAMDKLSDIDMVITDLEMPGMNGYELTRAIKAGYHDLPVLMVTSRDGEEDRLEGLKAGVDDYQAKLDSHRLLSSVRRHIKKSTVWL